MMKDSTVLVEHLLHRLNTQVYSYNAESNVPILVLLGIALIYLCSRINSVAHSVDAPTVGKRSKWEPNFWLRTRFFQEAWPIVKEGYQKARLLSNATIIALIQISVQRLQVSLRTE